MITQENIQYTADEVKAMVKTIEEIRKKYNDALQRAKKLQETCDSTAVVGWCEYLFPELAESEDERIRKEIIDFLGMPHPQFVGKRDHEKWIAWLEKQGEQHPHVDVNKMVDKFAHTEVKGHGVPSMIEVDAYRRGIEDALKYCLTYMI